MILIKKMIKMIKIISRSLRVSWNTRKAKTTLKSYGSGLIVNYPCQFTRNTVCGRHCNFNGMTIAGGGEKIKLSGSTSCRHKTIGSYIRWQVITKGFFKISDDDNLHLDRLDKLKRILEAKKPHITVKDSSVGKKYKCYLTDGGIDSLKKLIKKYKKAIKIYW